VVLVVGLQSEEAGRRQVLDQLFWHDTPALGGAGMGNTGTPPAARRARTASKTSRSALDTKYREPGHSDANASFVVRTSPARMSAWAMCCRPTDPPVA
jgi:hypothetical protein